MTDQYYVIGNPVAHSRSPEIHQQFAAQTGESLRYEKFSAPLTGFRAALQDLIGGGLQGANVTVPFKEEAFLCCRQYSDRAGRARAVNTLIIQEDGTCCGDNTDGVGLLTDLRDNCGVDPGGRQILILGAGGAVRGVLQALLEQQPERLVIANRTPHKALALADDFSALGNARGCGLDAVGPQRFDLIINGTSAGLQGTVPALPRGVLRSGGVTYDMFYGHEPTAFVRWGRQAGARLALDGLGMLVEQAAQAFYLWRSKRPDTRAVIQHLREHAPAPAPVA